MPSIPVWDRLKGNSTKTIFVIGVLTILSQIAALWPLDMPDVVQIIFSTLLIAFSVYTVQCLNTGGCTTFAWVTVLLPLIIYGLLFVMTLISGKSVMVAQGIVTQGTTGGPGTFGCSKLPRTNYSCDVPLQQKGKHTMKYDPVSSSEQVDFYSKNQFRDYYKRDSYSV